MRTSLAIDPLLDAAIAYLSRMDHREICGTDQEMRVRRRVQPGIDAIEIPGVLLDPFCKGCTVRAPVIRLHGLPEQEDTVIPERDVVERQALGRGRTKGAQPFDAG